MTQEELDNYFDAGPRIVRDYFQRKTDLQSGYRRIDGKSYTADDWAQAYSVIATLSETDFVKRISSTASKILNDAAKYCDNQATASIEEWQAENNKTSEVYGNVIVES